MMQNLLQKKLKLNYSKDVLDIVQFGSSLTEDKKPNDIDIAVIFSKIPVKEQLEQAQKIKKQLQKVFDIPVHISSYDLYSFFDKGNFAKEGILFYGKSMISGRYFSELFGIVPRVQISYSLNKLKKKDKVRFNYLLSGKMGKYGLLREYHGMLVSHRLIEIMPEHEKIFVNDIKEITSDFKIKKIFISAG
jgi:predicted nucleotidyltransferase